MWNCEHFALFLAHENNSSGSHQSTPAHCEKGGRVEWGKRQRWSWQNDSEVKVPSEKNELYPASVETH